VILYAWHVHREIHTAAIINIKLIDDENRRGKSRTPPSPVCTGYFSDFLFLLRFSSHVCRILETNLALMLHLARTILLRLPVLFSFCVTSVQLLYTVLNYVRNKQRRRIAWLLPCVRSLRNLYLPAAWLNCAPGALKDFRHFALCIFWERTRVRTESAKMTGDI